MARIENEPVAPAEAVDLTAAVDARAEVPPGDPGPEPGRVPARLVGAGAQWRQRGAPRRHRHRRHRHRLPDPQRPVPRTSEPGQPLLPEHDLHGPGDGRDLRAAARRDRPLGGPGHGPGRGRRLRAGATVRALQRRRRGDREVSGERPGLAVVGGDRRHPSHLRRHRCHPGEPRRPAAHAGPGRHPRRQPDPRRRDLHHPQHLGTGLDHREAVLQRARHLRHLQRQVRPAGRMDRPGGGRRGGRRVALAARTRAGVAAAWSPLRRGSRWPRSASSPRRAS